MLERDQLIADRMYRLFQKEDESDAMYFYTPDGIGGYWYDTKEEMLEELGIDVAAGYRYRIISAQIPTHF